MISSKPISKNQTANTVIGVMRGPVRGRTWFDTVNNPTYQIIQSGTGTVRLEGTNDVALRAVRPDEANPVERAILPTDGATWTAIFAAASTSQSSSFATAYEFLRLIVVTSGTGTVTSAWVRWN